MSLTPSTMIPLGTKAPHFSLPSTNLKQVSLMDFADKEVLVIMFICNHCPFVKHIQKKLVELVSEYQEKSVAFVGINSNDAVNYPDDDFESMKKEVEKMSYPFPYLFDETQKVAKSYSAACTPDIFVFDKLRKLAYRGQFDDSRPGSGEATGESLSKALDDLLAGKEVSEKQRPSTGCNIKWQPGNEPEYYK